MSRWQGKGNTGVLTFLFETFDNLLDAFFVVVVRWIDVDLGACRNCLKNLERIRVIRLVRGTLQVGVMKLSAFTCLILMLGMKPWMTKVRYSFFRYFLKKSETSDFFEPTPCRRMLKPALEKRPVCLNSPDPSRGIHAARSTNLKHLNHSSNSFP